jgi:hypothetical protein
MKKLYSVALLLLFVTQVFAQMGSPRRANIPQTRRTAPMVVQPQGKKITVAPTQEAQPKTSTPTSTMPAKQQPPVSPTAISLTKRQPSSSPTSPRPAKNYPPFASLVSETNRMMEIYNTFEPGSVVWYPMKDLQMEGAEIEKIKKDPYWKRFLSADGNGIGAFAAIELFQNKISDNLRTIVSHPDFVFKRNKRQVLSEIQGVKVAMSDDSRLYNFTFDSKDGSSFGLCTSVMHYIRPDGQSGNESGDKNDPVYRACTLNGYSEIVLLDKESEKYLLIGQVKKKANSYECYADVISMKDDVFVKDFDIQIQTDTPENSIVYNKARKTLTCKYPTMKATCGCFGNIHEKINISSSLNCECLFVFNGYTFMKQ